MAKKVYAIKEGFDSDNNIKIENKIVNTWAECLKYVKGVKNAKYKSFESMEEAKSYLRDIKDILKKEDNNYPKDCIHIYVDGSYNVNTNEYSFGMVAVEENVIINIESGIGKKYIGNNIRQIAGELEAAIKGVEYALSIGKKKVAIFHDYIGICYHATGFWDRKEESSIKYYEKMQSFMKEGIEIIFVKVDSHTGDLYNELADEKCKEKLGINSEKIVEKWLKNNNLYVANEEVRKEIISITNNKEDKIIITNKGDNSYIAEEKNLVEEIYEAIKNMPKEKQLKVLDIIKML